MTIPHATARIGSKHGCYVDGATGDGTTGDTALTGKRLETHDLPRQHAFLALKTGNLLKAA
jgi:hypothetical protein